MRLAELLNVAKRFSVYLDQIQEEVCMHHCQDYVDDQGILTPRTSLVNLR